MKKSIGATAVEWMSAGLYLALVTVGGLGGYLWMAGC